MSIYPSGMDVEANRKIGSCLQSIRRETGMTQTELARKLCKPQSYVSKVEIGERNLFLNEVFRYAKVLGVPPTVLIERVGQAIRSDK